MEENRNAPEAPAVDAGKANDESVIRLHAQLRRTPVAGSPIAFFTMIALVIVLIFGWFYHRRYVAGIRSDEYLPERAQREAMQAYLDRPREPAGPVEVDGAALYAQQCAACHQANGQGLAGAFPPLSGAEWVTADPQVPVKILLAGLSGQITVKGQTYNGAMPAFGSVFNDAEIAAIVSYVRTSWENDAGEVTAEQVAEIRANTEAAGPLSPSVLQEFMQ